jgi:hypothetical protein
MNREYKKQFRKALDNLPQHSPDDKVWEYIEDQLEFREQLTKVSLNLPVHEPSEQIWQNIEGKLENKKTRNIFPVAISYISIAAGIAALVVLSITFTQKNKEIVTKSVEISENGMNTQNNESDKITDKALTFIDNQCKSSNYLCEIPEFREKHQKLEEVNNELKKVNEEIESLGSSPSLFQTKTKLENLKARLIKDLVKQVTS